MWLLVKDRFSTLSFYNLNDAHKAFPCASERSGEPSGNSHKSLKNAPALLDSASFSWVTAACWAQKGRHPKTLAVHTQVKEVSIGTVTSGPSLVGAVIKASRRLGSPTKGMPTQAEKGMLGSALKVVTQEKCIEGTCHRGEQHWWMW